MLLSMLRIKFYLQSLWIPRLDCCMGGLKQTFPKNAKKSKFCGQNAKNSEQIINNAKQYPCLSIKSWEKYGGQGQLCFIITTYDPWLKMDCSDARLPSERNPALSRYSITSPEWCHLLYIMLPNHNTPPISVVLVLVICMIADLAP